MLNFFWKILDWFTAKPAFRKDRCLAFRYRASECRACVDACPVGAIELAPTELTVTDRCTGCGVCTSICPGHALTYPVTAAAERAFSLKAETVSIGCHRAKGDVTVECLGRLAVSTLFAATAGGAQRIVIAHGDCATCPLVKKGEHQRPVEVVRATVQEFTEQLKPLGRKVVVDVVQGTPAQTQAPAPPVSRRDLIRSWGREAGEGAAVLLSDLVPFGAADEAKERLYPEELRLRYSLLQRLVGRSVPEIEALHPHPVINDRCTRCPECTLRCPMTALQRSGLGQHIEITPQLCVGCGVCQLACPVDAIDLANTIPLPVLLANEQVRLFPRQ